MSEAEEEEEEEEEAEEAEAEKEELEGDQLITRWRGDEYVIYAGP